MLPSLRGAASERLERTTRRVARGARASASEELRRPGRLAEWNGGAWFARAYCVHGAVVGDGRLWLEVSRGTVSVGAASRVQAPRG
ncbi:hypothetical protein [Nonomuraea dietziae]|uniref:hypothetical protein n=1 Tax=Nonomuraea dietziae TaxID=65515 RepID=UPI0031DF6633